MKYFRWSDMSSPALVARFRLWISSTSTRSTRASIRTWQTASAMSVVFCPRRTGGRPRNRANSIASFRGDPFGGVVT
ncbi:MAG: hypothetical protein ABSD40_23655 [Streptosporangiaceae bacterium]